jgi:hypothetical protein
MAAPKLDKKSAGKFHHLKRKWNEWAENHADVVRENGFARLAAREVVNDIKFFVGLLEGRAPDSADGAEGDAELEEAVA